MSSFIKKYLEIGQKRSNFEVGITKKLRKCYLNPNHFINP